MAIIGGPVESASIAGRTFGVPADADVSMFLGGDSNTVESNGDGATGRILKEVKPFKISGLTLSIDDEKDDHQFLQDIYHPVKLNMNEECGLHHNFQKYKSPLPV